MNTVPITAVTRVYNATRNALGVVAAVQFHSDNAQWEITVTMPDSAEPWADEDILQVDYTYAPKWNDCDVLEVDYWYTPKWTDCDILEVDYTYVPTSMNHDRPVGARFSRIEGVLDIDPRTGEFEFRGETRYRTSIFTFPFSFIDTTETVQGYNPVAGLIASQMLFFNSARTIRVGRDDL
jgi:hypothetical protein